MIEEDLAVLEARLTEARSARHKVAIGGSVAEVWRDGRRITYTAANLSALESYIADLESEISRRTGEALTGPKHTRSFMQVRFGN